MAQSIHLPIAYLEAAGEKPVIPFQQWLKLWKNYAIARDLTNFDDARKRAILLHALGTEAQRMAENDDEKETYEECLLRLEKLFDPPKSRRLKRYELRKRVQQSDESLAQFAAAIRPLASQAKYEIEGSSKQEGMLVDKMATDQFIFGLKSEKLREKLFAAESELTLDGALQLSEKYEAAETDAKSVGENSFVARNSFVNINYVKKKQSYASVDNKYKEG